MKFSEITKARYSVRRYTSSPVEQEKLEQILQAAHVAPTAANRQPVRLFVIESADGLARLGKAANLYGAPMAIIVCCDRTKAWTRPFDGKQSTDIDAAVLTDHMMLQATELGLGSVWICCFKPDVVREEFSLPGELEPVNILAIGYADDAGGDPTRFASERIAMNELVSYH